MKNVLLLLMCNDFIVIDLFFIDKICIYHVQHAFVISLHNRILYILKYLYIIEWLAEVFIYLILTSRVCAGMLKISLLNSFQNKYIFSCHNAMH
jgi:hypothetical protein